MAKNIFADERMTAWMQEHLPELRQRYLSGQRLLYQSLAVGFGVGLAAHIGGYVLLSSAPSGALGLVGDLLKSLGLSLWTGVVVVLFVQVIPEAKRRQITHALDEYEAVLRDKTQGRSAGS